MGGQLVKSLNFRSISAKYIYEARLPLLCLRAGYLPSVYSQSKFRIRLLRSVQTAWGGSSRAKALFVISSRPQQRPNIYQFCCTTSSKPYHQAGHHVFTIIYSQQSHWWVLWPRFLEGRVPSLFVGIVSGNLKARGCRKFEWGIFKRFQKAIQTKTKFRKISSQRFTIQNLNIGKTSNEQIWPEDTSTLHTRIPGHTSTCECPPVIVYECAKEKKSGAKIGEAWRAATAPRQGNKKKSCCSNAAAVG